MEEVHFVIVIKFLLINYDLSYSYKFVDKYTLVHFKIYLNNYDFSD